MKKWALTFRDTVNGKSKTLYITDAKDTATDTELQNFMDSAIGVIVPSGYQKDSARLIDTTVSEKFDLIN